MFVLNLVNVIKTNSATNVAVDATWM